MNSGRSKVNIAISVVLCIPIIFIVYLFVIYTSQDASAKGIYQVTLSMPDSTDNVLTKDEDIQFYLDAMLDARKIDEAPRDIENEGDSSIIVTYQKIDKQLEYILFPSLDPTQCFFISPESECLLIDEATAQELLLRDEIEFIYPNSTLPSLSITASGVRADISPLSYDWNYKKIDENFYKDDTTSLQAEEKTFDLYADMVNELEFTTTPDSVRTEVYDEFGTLLFSTETLDISQLSFGTDMSLDIKVTAEWLKKTDVDEYGSAVYNIKARYDIPAKFNVSNTDIYQGDILVLSASFLDESETIDVETNLQIPELNFFKSGSKYVALLPVGSDNAAGIYSLTLKAGGRETLFDITVSELDTKIVHITPTTTLSDSANTDFKQMIADAYAETASIPYIDSGVTFFDPINAEVKYSFADEIFYDPSPEIVPCYGNYYAVTQGATIKASEKGKVVFADENEITGNTIIIDHGNGIQTMYCHLRTINVTLNSIVEKGVAIGTSGNTGYTTEGSFMFCATVNGVFVNPDTLLENGVEFEP